MTSIKLTAAVIGATLGISTAVLVPNVGGALMSLVIGVCAYKLFIDMSVIEYEVEVEEDETFI